MGRMDGALIIDKPAGMTSHDVVARVRHITGQRRAGHTGTLDPFATGVLVILVGRATRLAQFLSGAEKEYEATIRFGYATDTGDVTGAAVDPRIHVAAQRFSPEEIDAAIRSLRGESEQIPPMYSAKKIGGRKLYELARRGEEVERQPVRITVSEFEPLPRDGRLLKQNADETVDLEVRVKCSAGTYVRALAEDLGKQLGVGAHLAALRRTRAGHLAIRGAISLEQLAALAPAESISTVLVSLDQVISHLPAIELASEDAQRVLNGIDVAATDPRAPGDLVRLLDTKGELLAVGVFDAARSSIHPKVVIAERL